MSCDEHLLITTKEGDVDRCSLEVEVNVRVVVELAELMECCLDKCMECSPKLFFLIPIFSTQALCNPASMPVERVPRRVRH